MSVTITDVVLRDGLQDEDVVVSTDHKIAVADTLVAAGVKHIEAASFVSPTRVPQMADADDVIARLPRTDRPSPTALWHSTRAECTVRSRPASTRSRS